MLVRPQLIIDSNDDNHKPVFERVYLSGMYLRVRSFVALGWRVQLRRRHKFVPKYLLLSFTWRFKKKSPGSPQWQCWGRGLFSCLFLFCHRKTLPSLHAATTLHFATREGSTHVYPNSPHLSSLGSESTIRLQG